MRDEQQLDKEKAIEQKLEKIARVLGEQLSARGIPFVCIIDSPVGNVIRCAYGMQDPVNRNLMAMEAIKYINFLTERYSS